MLVNPIYYYIYIYIYIYIRSIIYDTKKYCILFCILAHIYIYIYIYIYIHCRTNKIIVPDLPENLLYYTFTEYLSDKIKYIYDNLNDIHKQIPYI